MINNIAVKKLHSGAANEILKKGALWDCSSFGHKINWFESCVTSRAPPIATEFKITLTQIGNALITTGQIGVYNCNSTGDSECRILEIHYKQWKHFLKKLIKRILINTTL